jgi:spore germination cell wall hydrolase CwlJ-like protein
MASGYEIALACLALNIWHEAGSEPIEGQKAVAYVTINRANALNKDLCETVFEDDQFSWTIGNKEAIYRDGQRIGYKVGPSKRVNQKSPQWLAVKALAVSVMSSWSKPHPYRDMFYFHATYVNPTWSKQKPYKMQIGQHKFYGEQEGIRYGKENAAPVLSVALRPNQKPLQISFRRLE